MSSTINTQTSLTRAAAYLGRTGTFVGSPGDRCPNIGSLRWHRDSNFFGTCQNCTIYLNFIGYGVHPKSHEDFSGFVLFDLPSLGVIALNVECRTLMLIEAEDPREIHAVRTFTNMNKRFVSEIMTSPAVSLVGRVRFKSKKQ